MILILLHCTVLVLFTGFGMQNHFKNSTGERGWLTVLHPGPDSLQSYWSTGGPQFFFLTKKVVGTFLQKLKIGSEPTGRR